MNKPIRPIGSIIPNKAIIKTTDMNKKRIIAIIVAAVALVAVVWKIVGGGKDASPVSYKTAKVEKATMENSITATGTIEPVISVEVGTQVSGIIDKIYVDYNSVVKRGQVIAELDKTNLVSQLNTANSNLQSAKSDLDYQAQNYKRIKALHDKGLVSDNEFDTASLQYHQAKATYAARQEAVTTAKTNLGYATITSPIDGVILSRAVEEGQTVASSFSTPTLFTIAQDLTNMRVIANVDEADIGGVLEGQNATFTVDAYPNDTFKGKVTQVRQEATTENNVVTYEVVISAPNADLKLKPGLTANVMIFTLSQDGVVSVPSRALRFTPQKQDLKKGEKIVDCNGKLKLWTKNGDTFTAHAVTTGMTDGKRTQITGGLKEGTEIIVEAEEAVMPSDEEMSDGEAERSPLMPGPPNKKKK